MARDVDATIRRMSWHCSCFEMYWLQVQRLAVTALQAPSWMRSPCRLTAERPAPRSADDPVLPKFSPRNSEDPRPGHVTPFTRRRRTASCRGQREALKGAGNGSARAACR